MADFLRDGSEAQRTVILFEVQQLLSHCFDETIRILIPILCNNVHLWSEELQISVSEALSEVVQHTIPKATAKLVADAAFRVIENNQTEDSFEAWGEILVIVLPEVQWDGEKEISKVIRTIDDFSKTRFDACRKLAARVLGSLSVCLKTDDVKNFILKRALIMSEDSDVEVRGMVAESFAFIGAGLEIGVTETLVWPQIVKLLKDPDARIHAACLRTISNIVEAKQEKHADALLFRRLLPPVFFEECVFARRAASQDQRKVDDDTYLLLEVVAEVFGPFLHAIHTFIDEDSDKKEAFKTYFSMSTCNGPIVRRYCAYNMPGVSISLKSRFLGDLATIAAFLSKDSDSETRWNLAAGLHHTCNILGGKHTREALHTAILGLLSDEHPLVRMNALQHFHDLLKVLSQDPDVNVPSVLTPMFQKLSLLADGNWRTQEILARQLEGISELVPFAALEEHILPLLYQMAEEGTHYVRKRTMPAIAKTIWCIPRPNEREEVLKGFYTEWGRGGVFWMRISFIDCAEAALKVFSADLFLFLFGRPLFQLARDIVPNVRLRIAKMFHEMAPFAHKDEEYKETMEYLKTDTDEDVRDVMSNIDERIGEVMKDMKTFRKGNEVREEKEARLEERAERERLESRKRTTRTKLKAARILPNIATKAGAISTLGRSSSQFSFSESSPVSVASTARLSKSSSRFGSMLPTLSLKSSNKHSNSHESSGSQTPPSPRSGFLSPRLGGGGVFSPRTGSVSGLLSPRGASKKALKLLGVRSGKNKEGK